MGRPRATASGLVVVQFAVTIALLITTLVIHRQIDFRDLEGVAFR